MRKGLLTELIGVFEDAKEHRREYGGTGPGLDDLRDEVLRLLREGDRLKRRAENAPPSSGRKPTGPSVADLDREGMLMGGPQSPPDTSRIPKRPEARPRPKDAP